MKIEKKEQFSIRYLYCANFLLLTKQFTSLTNSHCHPIISEALEKWLPKSCWFIVGDSHLWNSWHPKWNNPGTETLLKKLAPPSRRFTPASDIDVHHSGASRRFQYSIRNHGCVLHRFFSKPFVLFYSHLHLFYFLSLYRQIKINK